MAEEQYVCAVSGVAADAADDDEIPVGWAEVSILIRRPNVEHDEMLQARDLLVEQQLSQVPDGQKEAARPLATLLARATFAALEVQTPKFLVEEHEVHVSAEHLPALMELLGIEAAEEE